MKSFKRNATSNTIITSRPSVASQCDAVLLSFVSSCPCWSEGGPQCVRFPFVYVCVSECVLLVWTCAVCQIPHWVGWRSNHTLHSLSVSQRGDNSNYSNTHIHMPILTVIILINKLVSSQDQCIWRKRPEKSGTESDGKITWPHVALNGGIAPWTNITPRYKEINKAQLRSCLLAKVTN